MNNKAFQAVPKALIDSTRQKLAGIMDEWKPYFVNLSADDIAGMAKMSDKSLPFAKKARLYATTNKEFAPAFMDGEAFELDMQNVENVTPVQQEVAQFAAALNALLLVSNSEAYEAALLYYSGAKLAAAQGAPSARTIVEDMGQRFASRARKAAEKPADKPAV